eukprot:TRINITY_DN41878_c0_g1_i1.p1 TRINITY_DN41878_c0_g1~~TRINITY_DN41878_c0_g1_i1.p1  ORF type:complete len:217 (+),score=30.48 TRINITY_DN41878_c0_g1_i1:70-720(+)
MASQPRDVSSVQAAAQTVQAVRYGNSWYEYVKLLGSPHYDPGMWQLRQTDWKAFYIYWNILYVNLGILGNLLAFVMPFLIELFSIVGLIFVPFQIGILLIEIACLVFPGHMGWYCLVKREGCFGQLGYLCWAAYYALFPCWNLLSGLKTGKSSGTIVTIMMLLPAVMMVYACVQLAHQPFGQDQARSLNGQAAASPNLPADETAPSAPPPEGTVEF